MNQNGAKVTLTELDRRPVPFQGDGRRRYHILALDLTSGPIGYQPPLQDGPTLVLNDLKQPGNYTFKLTVEDSDHVKNSTAANITVLNHTDYPLRLMRDKTRVHIVLKVTDSSGQSSTADVHVFVKPPTNTPPVADAQAEASSKADAGGDLVLNLPVTVLILNGSKSSDDFRIVSWKWSRSPSGLAAGTVILNSDTQPVLMKQADTLRADSDGRPGRVRQGHRERAGQTRPLEMNLMELTLNVPISTFTQSQLDSLVQKMTLLLKDDIRVNVTEVHGQIDSGNTQLIFFLSEQGKAVEGIRALSLVRGTSGSWGSACWRSSTPTRSPTAPRARPKYRLLPLADTEDKPFTSKDVSETETDSDVLFETKSKTTSFATRTMNGEASQGNGWKKNGHYKTSRKVKT
uniref:Uncharacterized protein n=1 Tax=Heliothis virescens TaxID=7102 RepID=A0A2A4JWH0_HELVI